MKAKDDQGSGKERDSRTSASSHKRRRETAGTPASRARFFRTLALGFPGPLAAGQGGQVPPPALKHSRSLGKPGLFVCRKRPSPLPASRLTRNDISIGDKVPCAKAAKGLLLRSGTLFAPAPTDKGAYRSMVPHRNDKSQPASKP